jgi:uncharacterized membrane protein
MAAPSNGRSILKEIKMRSLILCTIVMAVVVVLTATKALSHFEGTVLLAFIIGVIVGKV